ncbi:MAG: hypothetical protein QOF62_794 [Pyrinomonadaceae bacterium]|jgi:hypothetical protein|nr:hypothetical protein [Pyrinomonadaceae bacterium]
MKPTGISRIGISILTVLCATATIMRVPDVGAQDQPPPLKIVARQDRVQLEEEKDTKDRVRLTLALAESHLANAELQTSHLNYDEAAAEAGKYWALIEDVFLFLSKQKLDSNKTRDLYKRVELTLRAHGPRLSIMRRTTPSAYAIWIKETEDFARQGRTEALNSFYGHTVVRERPSSPEQRPDRSSVQNNAVPPEKKP